MPTFLEEPCVCGVYSRLIGEVGNWRICNDTVIRYRNSFFCRCFTIQYVCNLEKFQFDLDFVRKKAVSADLALNIHFFTAYHIALV